MPRVSVDKTVLDEIQGRAIKYENGYLLYALTALDPQPLGWQPIETAPRDGTTLILAWPNNVWEHKGTPVQLEVSHGYYHPRDQKWVHNLRVKTPSYWMPLPDAPEGVV